MNMYRQGDVLIVECKIPEAATLMPIKNNTIILAEGEATGHAHAIRDKNASILIDQKTNRIYLRVLKPVVVRHEEHKEIKLSPTTYEVIRQRQYTPAGVIRVTD